ncbi:unnamed protein product [Owenia fusiformis]|uniref:Uncharacterized protein n=1 Tax=Owenia fusiformis TaxID=6347 RepID=A0A8J1UWZ8_OWEFU|nr:unnamed protein product [Owenia fusiformis]
MARPMKVKKILYISITIVMIFVILSYKHTTKDTVLKRRDIPIDRTTEIKEISLATMDVFDKDDLTLPDGWWVSRKDIWKEENDCGTEGLQSHCAKVLVTKCRPKSKNMNLFIPLKQNEALRGFYLSLRSSGKNLVMNRTLFSDDVFFFGAMVAVRHSDFSTQILEMSLPPGGEGYTKSDLHIVPFGKASVTSITIALTCHGFVGKAKFTDIQLKPILNTQLSDISPSDFVESCPTLPSPLPDTPKFKMKHVVISKGKFDVENSMLTLITQLSLARLDALERVIKIWDGPVAALVVYVPLVEGDDIEDQEKQRQLAHTRIMKVLNSGRIRNCHIIYVYGNQPDEEYPVNHLRNIGIRTVKTEYMFILDVDFIPSSDFQKSFELAFKRQYQTASEARFKKEVYVSPAFECVQACGEGHLPRQKRDLIDTVSKKKPDVQIFRGRVAPDAHGSTDYAQWYTTDKMYSTTNYQNSYEPYIIIRKHDNIPVFDERFSAYGMNKVGFMMELKASGYEFVVLPDCWVTHVPHENSPDKNKFLHSRIEKLKNRILRFEYLLDLSRKYRIGKCQTQT